MLNLKKRISATGAVCLSLILSLVLSLVGCGGGGSSQPAVNNTETNDTDNKENKESSDSDAKNKDDAEDTVDPNPDETYLMEDSVEDKEDVIKAEYKVEKGTFEKREFCIGNVKYTDIEYEAADISNNATVKKIKVNVGDEIKKGDVILTYEPDVNEIDIKRRTYDVEKREKEYEAGLDARKAELKMAENELNSLSDPGQIKIKKLEIEKLKLGLEKNKATKKTI